MNTIKLAITLDKKAVAGLDRLVKARAFASRSKAVQQAVKEKLARMDRRQLARECAKLNPQEEKAMAEEGMETEIVQWAEY